MGRLPAAMDFAEYERAVPGAGERILAMAERDMEDAAAKAVALDARLRAQSRREHATLRFAQGSVVLLSLAAIAIGSGLLFLSESWFGGLVALGVPTVAMITLAVTTHVRARHREDGKRPIGT